MNKKILGFIVAKVFFDKIRANFLFFRLRSIIKCGEDPPVGER